MSAGHLVDVLQVAIESQHLSVFNLTYSSIIFDHLANENLLIIIIVGR